MFTPGMAVITITAKFLVGCLVGLATAALILRSRLTVGQCIRSSVLAGFAFMMGSGAAGWADAHAAFQDGRRMDFAPWGEDLRLRNVIAENEMAMSLGLSVGAALLINVRRKRSSE